MKRIHTVMIVALIMSSFSLLFAEEPIETGNKLLKEIDRNI